VRAEIPIIQELLVNSDLSRVLHSLQRNILAGLITAGPLFVTWLVFSFILGVLANVGLPLVKLLAYLFPGDGWINQGWFQYVFAVLLTVALFYLVGRVTSQVMGRQMFALFEASLERLPLVNKIYTSVRQLVDTLTSTTQTGQRVVLIEFPIAGQKTIGFLTHMIADATTGMPVAAVLVPQAINPSSAFLQFVPMEMVTETDLSMEQAMSMLLTGGAVCPEVIRYSAPVNSPDKGDGSSVGVTYAVEDDHPEEELEEAASAGAGEYALAPGESL
jgi:uncharacterized membrane protein